MFKSIVMTIALASVAACTSYEQAVDTGKARCSMIGYEIDRNDNERIATLGCIERQADNVVAGQTRTINTAVGVVTAGAVLSNLNQSVELKY